MPNPKITNHTLTYLNSIFSAASNKKQRSLNGIGRAFRLDSGFFTDREPTFQSAVTMLLSARRNDAALFLILNSNNCYEITAQALAYLIANNRHNEANELIVFFGNNKGFNLFHTLKMSFNYYHPECNSVHFYTLSNFFLNLQSLSTAERLDLVAECVSLYFLRNAYNPNIKIYISEQLQNEFFVRSVLTKVHLFNPALSAFLLFVLKSSCTDISTSLKIDEWHWKWQIDRGAPFAAIQRFLSDNLMDRISDYRYAFCNYSLNGDLLNFSYTISFIDAHEGDQANLIKSMIFDSSLHNSYHRAKSLEELPLRFNTLQR